MLAPIQNGQITTRTVEGVEPLLNEQVDRRDPRRHQFDIQDPFPPKSLYRQFTRLVNNFLQQIMGRDHDEGQGQKPVVIQPLNLREESIKDKPREVRGIADRAPRPTDAGKAQVLQRDLILLGEGKDYDEPVIAIQFDGKTKPVFYEGNQVVARNLHLDSAKPVINGQLILADGSKLPVHIHVLTAI